MKYLSLLLLLGMIQIQDAKTVEGLPLNQLLNTYIEKHCRVLMFEGGAISQSTEPVGHPMTTVRNLPPVYGKIKCDQ